MKKKNKSLNFIFIHIINILLVLSNIHSNNCECLSNEPFQLSGICITDCTNIELFQDKTCIPISIKESDITEMFDKISSYYSSINVNTITNPITIEGENINYIITTNIIENSNTNSFLLNFGQNCINNINSVTSDFYIVLINILNTDYITSSNGIRLFNNNNDKYLLSNLCNKQTINIGVSIQVTNTEKDLYKQIKNEYGYDIFNIYDKFYTDKCTKFTTPDKTDISLQRRNEEYGIYTKNVCSNICTYQKFDNDENKIYCSCILGGEKKEKNDIEIDNINIKIIKCFNEIGKDIKKNYLFFIMGILCFLFLLCFIITCIRLSKNITKYVDNFDNLKNKFMEYYQNSIKQKEKAKNQCTKKHIKRNRSENNITEKEEEEEDDDESNGSDETNVNNNNFNMMNNPYNYYQNYYVNNQYNPYAQYQQYQQYQYQMYNQYMMNYMKNLNNQNNNKENDDGGEDEEEDDEENEEEEDDENEEEEDDSEEEDNVENEEKKDDEDQQKNKNEIIKKRKSRQSIFPQFKDIDDNLVYKISLDYDKAKEYSNFLKRQNEEKNKEETKNNQESEEKNDKNNINKKENKNPEKIKKKKHKKKKNKEKDELKKKKKEKKRKKEKHDINENNKIEIFKKKENIINIDDQKKKQRKSKSKEKDLKDIIKLNKKEILNQNKNQLNINNKIIKQKKNQKRPSIIDIIQKKNNKPNPPKNSITSEKEIISQESKSNNESKSQSQQSKENEEKKEDNLSEKIEIKQENEKEQKIHGLNLNSNGDNSTVDNILINSKYFKKDEISLQKQSTQYEKNISLDIKFGSDEFYTKLNNIPEYKRKLFFSNSELNFLDYEHCYDVDTRSFSEIYSSIINEENNIIFSFSFCADDYNISFAKFSLFIIQIILYLSISCLFFVDDIINNIYDKKNEFDIAYMIKPSLFTFLICLGINIPLKILIKSNNNVIDIKYEIKTFEQAKMIIRLKIFFYYFIGFIFMIFGFFLVSIFSAVYINSQIKLIICAFFTLIGNFVLQIIFSFLITSLRICALTSAEKDRKCLYNFTKALTYI